MSASDRVVGVVGLGKIGGGVAGALATKGWSVTAFDVSAQARERHSATVRLVQSPAAVASAARVVLIAVFDDAQLREVLAGPGGIVEADRPGCAAVVLSTVSLDTIEWAGELGSSRGFAVVDCGVSGGAAPAAEGTLVSMLGGEQPTVEAVLPVVEGFSSKALHVGPLGAGIRLKLARNLVTYGSWLVADEAARLVAAGGVTPASLVDVILASDPLTGAATGLLAGGSGGGHGRAALAAIAGKDVRAAASLAERAGLDLPFTRLAAQRIEPLIEHNQTGDVA